MAEQTAIAAMDCNSFDLAFSLTNDLRRRFPKSKRASRLAVSAPAVSSKQLFQICEQADSAIHCRPCLVLTPLRWQAMYFEARGKFDKAAELQEGILEEAPDNMTMLKRQVRLKDKLALWEFDLEHKACLPWSVVMVPVCCTNQVLVCLSCARWTCCTPCVLSSSACHQVASWILQQAVQVTMSQVALAGCRWPWRRPRATCQPPWSFSGSTWTCTRQTGKPGRSWLSCTRRYGPRQNRWRN